MAAPTTSGKTRSPNYPSISLYEAIQRLNTIYGKQQRYPAPREVFATLLGYSGLNGASAAIVSALSKYGLLEGHGESLRVSEVGQDLVLHRKGDPEYTDALRTAAFLPTFFRELRDQFPKGLPSDHSLRATLIKKGFNPKAIDGAVRAYQDTMEFLESETGDSVAESSESAGGNEEQHIASIHSPSVTPPVQTAAAPMVVMLSPTLTAEIIFRGGQPSPRDLRFLGRYLELSEEALATENPVQSSQESVGGPDQFTEDDG